MSGVLFVSALSSAQVDIARKDPLNLPPQIVTLKPGYAVAGAIAQFTVEGRNFSTGAVVRLGGVALPTLWQSDSTLQATVPARLLTSAGTLEVTVRNPAPGGESVARELQVLPGGVVIGTRSPLVANYSITAPAGASVSVEFGRSMSYGWKTSTQISDGNPLEILVAGMRADTAYHMRARILLSDASLLLDSDHIFTTGSLPAGRTPAITITRSATLAPQPGVELLSLISDQLIGAAVTDLDGNIIWYYDSPPQQTVRFLRQLQSGHLLMILDSTQYGGPSLAGGGVLLREVDLAGTTIRELSVPDLNHRLAVRGYSLQVSAIHHDVIELPNGHLLALATTVKPFRDLPGYPGTTNVMGDALIDLDANLQPVWTWSGFDHLDVNRHLLGLPDWTHANAVVYLPADGNVMVSMRHQSWIIKIDYHDGVGTGAIVWRLGNQGDFQLSGSPAAWFYSQHYPGLISSTSAGMRFALMDNGLLRVTDSHGDACNPLGSPACYSRAIVVQVNEVTRNASIAREYLPGLFSIWGGSADLLANGNLEGDFCQSVAVLAGGSRITETTADPQPQLVWQMDITGESAYRGYRIPSLYPGVKWTAAP